jgi:hypothetical protein
MASGKAGGRFGRLVTGLSGKSLKEADKQRATQGGWFYSIFPSTQIIH